MLAVLALNAPEPVSRVELINLLWSRREAPQARGSLRQALRELRGALGPAAVLLRIDRGLVALDDTHVRIDARDLLSAGPANPDPLALWQDALLPDLTGLDPAFDRWLAARREHLRHCVRLAATAVLTEASTPTARIAAAERLLSLDPAHETSWQALIRGHIDVGDRAAALASYERCRASLSATCQTSPSPETATLVAALRMGHGAAAGTATALPRHHVVTASRIRVGISPLVGGGAGTARELAAALTEELIVALARFRALRCIPSTDATGDAEVDFRLTGTVRMEGRRVRVLVRLMDQHMHGEVVWAERFDHVIDDMFALQEELAGTTAARIDACLWRRQSEWAQLAGGARRADPQDLVRIAVPALFRLDRPAFMMAGQRLDRSVELDPDNGSAHAWAAQWHMFCVGQGWAADPAASMQRSQDLAERAVQLDPEDGRALSLAGHVRGFLNRRPEEALRLHERALRANPHQPLSWCFAGLAHSYVGEWSDAIRCIRHAQTLCPDDPLQYFYEMSLCMPHLLRGEFDIAAAAGRRAIALNPEFSSAHKGYLAAAGHLGRQEEVDRSRAVLLGLEPGFSVAQAMSRSPIAPQDARTLYAEGLRAAGLR